MDYLQYRLKMNIVMIQLITVLNLIINGLPSIHLIKQGYESFCKIVLNLIINGLPSIHQLNGTQKIYLSLCFKPYYKWITFNTQSLSVDKVCP